MLGISRGEKLSLVSDDPLAVKQLGIATSREALGRLTYVLSGRRNPDVREDQRNQALELRTGR